jgi:fructan beta-fructosidase
VEVTQNMFTAIAHKMGDSQNGSESLLMLRPVLLCVVALAVSFGCVEAAEKVIADFEGQDFGPWKSTGDAFGASPTKGAVKGQQPIHGFIGEGLANSFCLGDGAIGELISPEFEVTCDYISLLLGGGNFVGKVGAELLIDGKVVRSTSGSDSEEMLWHSWPVHEFRGARGRIRIIDRVREEWGHVVVDQIVQTDEPKSSFDFDRLEAYRKSPDYYREPFRPQYHFTPEVNWMNDPNGMVYYNGEYHLFYQYNPYGNTWGHMSWGHAVSRDLVHWIHLPIALWEENGQMMFTGSAVVDHANTSGFGTDGRPPMVAIYTRHQRGNQSQCLAFSNDFGRTWRQYAGNPVLDIGEADFRDPKVFWHEPTKKWVMAVSLAIEKRIQFYGSADLKDWEFLSEFGPAGAPNKPNWECPELFELPIENEPGKTKWVLQVGMGGGAAAGGSGGEYFLGDFDGEKFTSDDPSGASQWSDYGRDFYADVTWSDVTTEEGGRVWVGWMNNWETCLVPTSPWRGAMSLPRSLALRNTNGRLHLVQRPYAGLKELRNEHWTIDDKAIEEGLQLLENAGIRGTQLELVIDIAPGDADEVGLRVREGEEEVTVVGYDVKKAELFVDRTKSGSVDFHAAFPGRHAAPLPLEYGRLKIHVFVDSSSVEVFGRDGAVVITDLIFPSAKSVGAELYSRGGEAKLISFDAWSLKSIWRDE